jgi:hypothetical protein
MFITPVSAAAAIVAAAVIIADLVRRQAVPNTSWLLVAGAVILVIGQVWMVSLGIAQRPTRGTPWTVGIRTTWASRWSQPPVRETWFPHLPPMVANLFLTVAFLGWVAAFTALAIGLPGGGPDLTAGCPYSLESHGVITCVTRQTYDQAGADLQRFAAGIFLAFFSLHAGAALSHARSGVPKRGAMRPTRS